MKTKENNMKSFELIQGKFAVVGYSLNNSNRQYNLNARNVIIIILMVINMLATSAYIYYEAESFDEYLQDIYLTVSLAVASIMFIINIVLMPKVFKLIENLKETINKSKHTDATFLNELKFEKKYYFMLNLLLQDLKIQLRKPSTIRLINKSKSILKDWT